jgi:hypothetical protein
MKDVVDWTVALELIFWTSHWAEADYFRMWIDVGVDPRVLIKAVNRSLSV